MHPLDNPIWHALAGPHARLAVGGAAARRYRPDVAMFAALAEPTRGWAQLGPLAPGMMAMFTAHRLAPPAGWPVMVQRQLEQMTWDAPCRVPDVAAVELGQADLPDIMALMKVAEPGPFLPGTIACGRYVGWRAPDGTLAAMAGERLRLPDRVEISAVCTHPAHRGRGLAAGLMQALMQAAVARGQAPFLHVETKNTGAIALYERLGFRRRPPIHLTVLRPPNGGDDDGDRPPHAS